MTIHRFFMYAATLGAIGLSIASTVFAADKQIHLRGEITSISDVQLTVKASTGTTTTVQLTDKLKVHDVSRTDLSAIAENSYIGIAAAPSGAGKAKALGVMVFPEGARGLNEGHFPWDKVEIGVRQCQRIFNSMGFRQRKPRPLIAPRRE